MFLCAGAVVTVRTTGACRSPDAEGPGPHRHAVQEDLHVPA